MKYLLDTHIWIWSVMQPDRLSPKVDGALTDPTNDLYLSPVSIWELTLLCRKKHFRVEPDISTWVAQTISDLQLIEASLTNDVALALSSIRFSHADPADQFLVATAKVFELTLITADKHLLALKDIRILPNR
jgi:PIN domain nuclease of toxin-antitoxin system